jgi:hypothetical protein
MVRAKATTALLAGGAITDLMLPSCPAQLVDRPGKMRPR